MATKLQRNPSTLKLMRSSITGKLMRITAECPLCISTPLTIVATFAGLVNNLGCFYCPGVSYTTTAADIASILNGAHTLYWEGKNESWCKWSKTITLSIDDLYWHNTADCSDEPVQISVFSYLYVVVITNSDEETIVYAYVYVDSPEPSVDWESYAFYDKRVNGGPSDCLSLGDTFTNDITVACWRPTGSNYRAVCKDGTCVLSLP